MEKPEAVRRAQLDERTVVIKRYGSDSLFRGRAFVLVGRWLPTPLIYLGREIPYSDPDLKSALIGRRNPRPVKRLSAIDVLRRY